MCARVGELVCRSDPCTCTNAVRKYTRRQLMVSAPKAQGLRCRCLMRNTATTCLPSNAGGTIIITPWCKCVIFRSIVPAHVVPQLLDVFLHGENWVHASSPAPIPQAASAKWPRGRSTSWRPQLGQGCASHGTAHVAVQQSHDQGYRQAGEMYMPPRHLAGVQVLLLLLLLPAPSKGVAAKPCATPGIAEAHTSHAHLMTPLAPWRAGQQPCACCRLLWVTTVCCAPPPAQPNGSLSCRHIFKARA
jgi:hypothetical protein